MQKMGFLRKKNPKKTQHSVLGSYIARQRSIRTAGFCSSVTLLGMLTFLVFPVVNQPLSVEATTEASAPSATTLDMVVGSTDADVSIVPNDVGGTFASSAAAETARFSVTTDNYSGYTLTIEGSDDEGLLTNTDTSITENNTFSSVSSPTTEEVFSSPNGTAFNGKWGYKPSRYDSSPNTSFLPAPTTDASTLDETNSPGTTEYTIALGARADYDKPVGTYTNSFSLAVVGNPIVYSVTYANDTGDSTVVNLPSFGGDPNNHTQTGSVSDTSITLSSTIPTRNNYSFLYWCMGSTTNSGTVCSSGVTYAAGAEFGIDQTTENNTTLNAVWNPNITIRTDTGISKVSINKKATTDSGSDDIVECTRVSGCTVEGLTYGKTYDIVATPAAGYSFSAWSAGDYGTIANTAAASTTYTVGGGPSIIAPTAVANTYTLTLINSSATTSGSTAARVTYASSDIYGGTTGTDSITNPSRVYTVSGFDTSYNNADGAEVSSAATLNAPYNFNGWYTAETGGEQIIYSSKFLVATTTYTDNHGNWASTQSPTLYAQWGSATAVVTLPTISKTGHTCGWTASTDTSTITYASGYADFIPTANTVLHGVCRANTYPQAVQVRRQNATGGWSSYTSYSSCAADVAYGDTYSCSIPATDEYEAASVASYTVDGARLNSVDIYRKTKTVALTAGTGVSSVSLTGTGVKEDNGDSSWDVYYGGAVTMSATMADNYEFINWTGSATYTNQTQNIASVTSDLSFTANGEAGCQNALSGSMQDFDPSVLCSGVTSGTLTDNRGTEETYNIAKLADGNWWMLDNLRLGAANLTITSDDSNVESDFTFPQSSPTSFNSYNTAKVYFAKSKDVTNYGTGSKKVGVYYNYCAATAGTYCYGQNDGTGNAQYDVCPKGWRMPTGGTGGEFDALYGYYNNNLGDFQTALSVQLSGFYSGSTSTDQNTKGYWWTSTYHANNNMHALEVGKTTINTTRFLVRTNGNTIRCILK